MSRGITAPQAIATSARLYVAHLPLMLGFGAVGSLPQLLLLLQTSEAGTGEAPTLALAQFAGAGSPMTDLALALLSAAVTPLAAALSIGMVAIAVREIRSGAQPDFDRSFKQAAQALPQLYMASVIAGVIILVGMVFLLIPGLVAAAGLSFAAIVVVLEDRGAVDALKRSWTLTRGGRLNIFLAFVILSAFALICYAPVMLLSGLVGLIGIPTNLWDTLLAFAFGSAFSPVCSVTFTSLYYEACGDSAGA